MALEKTWQTVTGLIHTLWLFVPSLFSPSNWVLLFLLCRLPSSNSTSSLFCYFTKPLPGQERCLWSLSAELQAQVPIWGWQDTLRRELKDCLSLSLVSFPQTLNSKWSTELGEHQVSDTVGVAFNGVAETGLLSPLDPASPWTDYGKGNKGIWRGKIED